MMDLAVAGGGKIVREVIASLAGWDYRVCSLCVTPGGRQRAEELAATCGNPRVYTDFDAMLADTPAGLVYIAVPNHLHFELAMKAMQAGKNVILEKPMTASAAQAEILADYARSHRRFLFEAITTLYQPDYRSARALLPRLGRITMVSCNFSQYSSRYDAFSAGETPPAFDPARAGGALMDLGCYNLHWVMGLLGQPEQARYFPNMERGIDTSGTLMLQYPGFHALCVCAKDSASPCRCIIQGTGGYLIQESAASFGEDVQLHLNDGTVMRFNTPAAHRLEAEFRAFGDMLRRDDFTGCLEALDHSTAVCRTLHRARIGAGVLFPSDYL